MSADIHPIIEIAMAACKPEVVVGLTKERNEIANQFQRLPHIFGQAQITGTAKDIVRCWPTTGVAMAEIVKTQE